ncbi:hypothetical protein DFH09DRAFT_1197501 [Mycena vulgaris]|nr:hypothetical protein DFH09DRAFT_1197501 [Mycena vulgaris]
MDPLVHTQRKILLDELCSQLIVWLKSLSRRRMANSLFGADSPYAADADVLPLNSPLDNFVIPKRFQWASAVAPSPRACQITFEYHGRTRVSSLLWTIQSSKLHSTSFPAVIHLVHYTANVTLGVFEIPPEVYDDLARHFEIGGHLILEALLKSVAAQRAVCIMSRVRMHCVGDEPATRDCLVKHFDLVALPERLFIRQIAARWMKECLRCTSGLPHPGPDICHSH